MDFTFEKNKLKSILGDSLYKDLKRFELIVAGGTITSLFTNNEINDIDVYGRCNEDVVGFMTEVVEDGSWIVSHTHKATQFSYNSLPVQLIHYQYFNRVEDIFDSFDFTVCMGAFDFKTEEFILHPDFLKHNSQRILKFNPNTSFPIISALRVQKYENKGYKISKPEFIRIALACMNLNITSYEELKDHLGGLYGVNYDKLFEDVKEEEFDLQIAMDKIADIVKSDEYFITPEPLTISIEDVLEEIDKSERVYFELRNKTYRVTKHGIITEVGTDRKADRTISLEAAIPFDKVYKFVKKNGDIYSSFHDSNFEYVIGEESVAKGELRRSGWCTSGGKLYFNLKDEIKKSSFFDRKGGVLIEAEFNVEDLVDIESDSAITVTRAKTIREVPEGEWKQWFLDSVNMK
jgi:hypothetical protein